MDSQTNVGEDLGRGGMPCWVRREVKLLGFQRSAAQLVPFVPSSK